MAVLTHRFRSVGSGMTARRTGLNSLEALAAQGLVDEAALGPLRAVAARYAVAITPAMHALIAPGDPADPIARQFVPSPAELETHPAERGDPIGDGRHTPVPGIVHRHPDRVLLLPTLACAVYCRFCFRREVVGPHGDGTLTPDALDAAFAYIAADPAIWEVVITGGDPLILSPRRLRALTTALADIDHVKIVRFHSRVPVVAPERVDAALVAAIRAGGAATWVVLHANHPRELTPDARAACARLVDAGIPMLSQSVLLRGVNDDPDTLAALMRALVETRIKPYYLHHLDPALGTGHFRTDIAAGQALLRRLRATTSGLCQPTYVLDLPGGYGKVPLGPCAATPDGAEGWSIEDHRGERHRYPPRPPAAGRAREDESGL